jgi:hypothetical protein
MAFAVGLLAVATDRTEGKYVISLIVNTDMMQPVSHATDGETANTLETTDQDSLTVSGRVAGVRPEKNEFVVSENVKDWTFRLATGGKVFINDREGTISDLQVGDAAAVTFDRQGRDLIASMVRATRK